MVTFASDHNTNLISNIDIQYLACIFRWFKCNTKQFGKTMEFKPSKQPRRAANPRRRGCVCSSRLALKCNSCTSQRFIHDNVQERAAVLNVPEFGPERPWNGHVASGGPSEAQQGM